MKDKEESVLFSRVWESKDKKRKRNTLMVTIPMTERVKWNIEYGDFIHWKIAGVDKKS